MTAESKITPEIAHRLLEWAADPSLTYEQMALMLKLKGRGNAILTPAEIATFLGTETNGAPDLNRLRRDRELADWLRQNQSIGALDDIRVACVAQFGAARVPPTAEMEAFLEREQRKYHVADIAISSEIAEYLFELVTGPGITYEQMAGALRVKFGRDTKLTAADIATFLGTVKKGAPFLNQLHRDREVADWLRKNQTLGSFDQIRDACFAQFGAPRVPSRSTVAAFLKSEGRKRRLDEGNFFSDKPEVVDWLREEYLKHTTEELRKLCQERFGKALTPNSKTLRKFLCDLQGTDMVRRRGIWVDEELSAWLIENAVLLRGADLHAQAVKHFGAERVGNLSAVRRFLASQQNKNLTKYKSHKEVEEGLKTFHAKAYSPQTK
ncbi:MAG: hypothetical protein ABF665_05505 [Gluconacetobacter sp.]